MAENFNAIDTLVVGGGQAGIAMSEHLTNLGIDHVVLEKNRIAEAWRTRRWDSLVANGPCWHDRFPNKLFNNDQEEFVPHQAIADYMEDYAKSFHAPIHTNVSVTSISPAKGQLGFAVETTEGNYLAQHVVLATGPFQKAIIPTIAPQDDSLVQLHSDSYKNPAQLPEGNVLVIGGGASGVQIADELNQAGKKVYLSVGDHERPPRKYRNRDNVWWLGVLGGWDASKAPGPLKGLAVSGTRNGHFNIDFRKLAKEGITLLGRSDSFKDGKVYLRDDLVRTIKDGEQKYLDFLDAADKFIADNGLDLPEEPHAREFLPEPECMLHPLRELDLKAAGITSIIWATGFGYDYSWVHVDAFDDKGFPVHKDGVSKAHGIYFLGLPYLTGRGSSFIWGVWHDAKRIADHINVQRSYLDYKAPNE